MNCTFCYPSSWEGVAWNCLDCVKASFEELEKRIGKENMDLDHTLERNWRRDQKMQFCCCWGGCWGDCFSLISSYASWVADRALFSQWHPHFFCLLILTQRILVCSRHPSLSISHPLASLCLCLFLLKNLEPSIRALQSLHSSQQVSLMPRMLNLWHWTKALTSSCWFLVLSVLIQKHFRWDSLQPMEQFEGSHQCSFPPVLALHPTAHQSQPGFVPSLLPSSVKEPCWFLC